MTVVLTGTSTFVLYQRTTKITECGILQDEQGCTMQEVNLKRKQQKTGRIAKVLELLSLDPSLSADQVQSAFKSTGQNIEQDTAYRYLKEAKAKMGFQCEP